MIKGEIGHLHNHVTYISPQISNKINPDIISLIIILMLLQPIPSIWWFDL